MQGQKKLQFSPEEVARLKARSIDAGQKSSLPDENLMVAEFGIMYGWGAIEAVLEDKIDTRTMLWLLEAGKQVISINRYNDTQARFIAHAASQSKEPSKTFKSLTEKMKKEADGIRI